MRISPIYYSSLLLTALHMAPAAEYYVATDGKDGNIGMSISNPWQTISRAVGHPGLTGGDTIHVRGGRYPEQVHVARSGLVNKPITIKAYVGETPVVDGNGINFQTLPNIGGVFQIVGSNVIIDGLRVINATVAENAVGILVRGPGVSNVTVRNCSTDNTRSSGIAAWGNSVDYSGIQNVRIEHNTITNAVNNGYQECLTISAGVDGFEVSGNTVRDCYSVPHEPNIPLGIDAKVNVRNGKIHDNLLFNLPYCSGIYVDGWDNTAYNIDIYNNVIHDVGHAGIQIGSEEGGTVYNINIFNNLIYKVRENGFAINHSNVSTPPNLYDIHFYQNTVYGSGYYAAHITADCRNLVVNNNIFSQNTWSNALTIYPQYKKNISMSNNLVDGEQNAWIAGQEIFLGTASIAKSPLFAYINGNNYRLTPGSPAIDAGISTWSALNDLEGRARPAGAGIDLGAYEHGSTIAPNVSPSVSFSTPANHTSVSAPATYQLSANAADSDGFITRVEFWNGTVKLGEDRDSAGGWSFTWSNVTPGSYALTAKAFDNGSPSLSTTSSPITVNANEVIIAQKTYGNGGVAWGIPASGTLRIQAENYDIGGEGVAYHDSDVGNNGRVYRSDDIDVHGTTDAGGGHAVGWFESNEWLEYSINVPVKGPYGVRLRVARGIVGNTTLRLLANGIDVTGAMMIPSTGGWDTWASVDTVTLSLNAGPQVLRVHTIGGCSLNWLELSGRALPDGWNAADVGAVALAGSASVQGDTWTVTGSGVDIWDSADEFQFASQALSGNGIIVARVLSLQNTDPWAKAGVMIRESTATGSTHAFCCVTSGNGVAFQQRSATTGVSQHRAGSGAGISNWIRLIRTGNTFTGYESANGTTWTMVGSTIIPMTSTVRWGLAVTSHADGSLATAIFDNVSLSPTATN